MHLLTWQSFGRASLERMKGNEQRYRAPNLPVFVILSVGPVLGLAAESRRNSARLALYEALARAVSLPRIIGRPSCGAYLAYPIREMPPRNLIAVASSIATGGIDDALLDLALQVG